jgi:hypothetical protein
VGFQLDPNVVPTESWWGLDWVLMESQPVLSESQADLSEVSTKSQCSPEGGVVDNVPTRFVNLRTRSLNSKNGLRF